MSETVWLSDPRVAAIPINDGAEPLVDLRTVPSLRLDHRRADPAGQYAHLRAGVVDRLVAAQSLLPRGRRLLIIEGYRPPWLQDWLLFEHTASIRASHPDWTEADVLRRALLHRPPSALAPHVTGAAVDLTLCDHTGAELPMGSGLEAGATHGDQAHRTDHPGVDQPVRDNRLLLGGVLLAVGLVNHPHEWWHWSYGDRYWALRTTRPTARYGSTHP
ncbi:M15 family metallopeptidase [Catellatospora sp. KI3]|uniref:M15 family metallopeptidase n=1 Tax=Catellatospora sp. KI3 TaxID=3041620 RepID=UPI0024827419|nr:M15 family metallopeptidase [Catellatospora sp. KI3]MDI1463251.1 M15 family metallopeptidase [Catellatospora sp. KI3]